MKTIKRDYARVSLRPDAASVLHELEGWFEHYNTIHPYRALGSRSPREFRHCIVEKRTEDAVGALRRPYDGTTVTEAIGSRPQPPQSMAQRQP